MIKSNIIDDDSHFGFDLKKLARKILKKTSKLLKVKTKHMISYIFVDLEKIQQINQTYRHIDRPTDVISFAYVDVEDNKKLPYELGDVFICKEKIVEQAKEYGHSFLRECAFLMTHGVLHLLGYDHQEKKEEERMIALQNQILNELHITR